jgi:hypothetical protein
MGVFDQVLLPSTASIDAMAVKRANRVAVPNTCNDGANQSAATPAPHCSSTGRPSAWLSLAAIAKLVSVRKGRYSL